MKGRKASRSRSLSGRSGRRASGEVGAASGREKSEKPARRQRAARPDTGRRATKAPEANAPGLGRDVDGVAGGQGSFPIVGIGASAGGLEALEQFLRRVPERSGMAFVVVQHLDPSHKGAMVEILQRVSPIPVVQVVDRQRVVPDRVYVIPPNHDMSILHGELHLLPQPSPRGLNLPIDFFFRSLALDQHERSIGVVLSGMGSDGTLGLRAIKAEAGAAFVQSLTSAKFDGMPRSAIEAGLADVVAAAEDIPERIAAYHRHAPYQLRPDVAQEERHQSALEKVFILLRAQTGADFSLYKRSTVQRRIERRMGLHQLDRMAGYVRYLRENPQELDLLFKELLIGVTSFFRDPAAWDLLRDVALPELIRSLPPGATMRAWMPGCSTGEEAYSLAIVFKEALEKLRQPRAAALQIFATDLDREAIEKARQGIYPTNIAADVSPERLRRFFLQDDRGYRVTKDIRETVVFAPQNVILDPPFTRLDVLCCRNLLIYLSPELQKKLIPLFHYSLNPGGVLFLGSAETVGGGSAMFRPLDAKARIYRRREGAVSAPPAGFPTSLAAGGAAGQGADALEASRTPPTNLQALADRAIIQRLAPATLLTTAEGDILYVSGRTGKYLEPAVGKASLNVFAMAREGLRYELSAAFSAALRQDRPVSVRGVKVATDGEMHRVDLTLQRLAEPRELRGTMMIAISDAFAPPEERTGPVRAHRRTATSRAGELERELEKTRTEVRTMREEMQTSQEELKSTNEELQSTNEELQSTNEELTTSKEEMQSMNEELQTVNQELQSKVDELSRSNNDMKNLLNSTDIATLFLDGELNVRRFTTRTAKLIKLIASDTGRPITDITTDLDYPDLADDAREVLRTLVFKERHVATGDGRWFTVRILPYRTLENVIDGVVITFTDSTASKRLEVALKEQASQLRQLAESLPNLVWGCRPDGACDYFNRRWVETTGVPEQERLGHGWLEQVHPEDRDRVREEWGAAVRSGTPFDAELRLRVRDGSFRWFKSRSAPIHDASGAVAKWYGTHTDVDDLKRWAEARRQAAERFAGFLDWIGEPYLGVDDRCAIVGCSAAAERALGRSRAELEGRRLSEVLPEPAGRLVEDRCRDAIRDRRAATFEVDLGSAGGRHRALVQPGPEETSVLLKPVASTGAPGTAGSEGGGA